VFLIFGYIDDNHNFPELILNFKIMKTKVLKTRKLNYSGCFRHLFTVLALNLILLNLNAQCNNNWSGSSPAITFQLNGTSIIAFSITFTNVNCFSSIGFTFSAITNSNGSFSHNFTSYPTTGTVTGTLSADGNSITGTYTVNLAYLHPVYFYPVSCGTISGNWSAVPETLRPFANAGADVAVNSGQSVTLTASGGVSYAWSGGISNGVAFVPTETKTYTVTVTAANGCTDTDDVIVTVTPSTSIFDTQTSSTRVQIYPNPATDEFTVSILKPEPEISISIFSVNGEVVYSKEYNCNYGNIFSEKIDPGVVPGGIYFVRVNNGQKSSTCKLVVK